MILKYNLYLALGRTEYEFNSEDGMKWKRAGEIFFIK
jgi:hypothetical protein